MCGWGLCVTRIDECGPVMRKAVGLQRYAAPEPKNTFQGGGEGERGNQC